MSASALPPAKIVAPSPPRFVTGSILRHILVMTGTSAVGLMAIFVSDFATVFFLGLLGDLQLLAAVGYGSSILFFMFSAGIGMSIAVTSLVAPALGAHDFAPRPPAVHARRHVCDAGNVAYGCRAVAGSAGAARLAGCGRPHACARARLPAHRLAVAAAAGARHVCVRRSALCRRRAPGLCTSR
jgi:hypothetical protein